ncbi:OprO/OprP family phosphate-selective porin [Rariglobus hedericola]|nr:porin [Rariglobus hedericola]
MRTLPAAVRTALATTITAVGLTATLPAQTASTNDLDALREQIRLLDQKLRILERNQELRQETAAADAKKQPKLNVGDGRVEVVSADGANSLRLRGLVQGDARLYLDDANAAQDGFVLRRARLIFEGKFSDIFQYTIQPEFGGTVQILDANINAAFKPGFQVRVGRFKTPIGLEQLQSDPVAFFNERSVVTNLTPNRDVGIQVHGDVLTNRLNYAVGVFNGVLDGGNSPTTNLNNEGDFTVAARLFATPWANDKESKLKGLGFGIAAGTGNYKAGVPLNPYRTDGQQNFFAYRSAVGSTTVADGTATTISPQAYFYSGPLGILAEYVSSSAELTNGANSRKLTNTGFNLSVGYVLTGEESSYKGVTPNTNFSLNKGTWGAFEVVTRVAQVDIDDDAFAGGGTSLAAAGTNATEVTTYGVGLNWYLSKAIRANFDIFSNKFDFQGARPATGALSDNELAFISRIQVSF